MKTDLMWKFRQDLFFKIFMSGTFNSNSLGRISLLSLLHDVDLMLQVTHTIYWVL